MLQERPRHDEAFGPRLRSREALTQMPQLNLTGRDRPALERCGREWGPRTRDDVDQNGGREAYGEGATGANPQPNHFVIDRAISLRQPTSLLGSRGLAGRPGQAASSVLGCPA